MVPGERKAKAAVLGAAAKHLAPALAFLKETEPLQLRDLQPLLSLLLPGLLFGISVIPHGSPQLLKVCPGRLPCLASVYPTQCPHRTDTADAVS